MPAAVAPTNPPVTATSPDPTRAAVRERQPRAWRRASGAARGRPSSVIRTRRGSIQTSGGAGDVSAAATIRLDSGVPPRPRRDRDATRRSDREERPREFSTDRSSSHWPRIMGSDCLHRRPVPSIAARCRPSTESTRPPLPDIPRDAPARTPAGARRSRPTWRKRQRPAGSPRPRPSRTRRTTLEIAAASATDVPPNFMISGRIILTGGLRPPVSAWTRALAGPLAPRSARVARSLRMLGTLAPFASSQSPLSQPSASSSSAFSSAAPAAPRTVL